ncbi:MAG TPA: hypothetical protein VK386_01425 [Acidimicrobiales bacterium]|nr:hypothetical protein [Acidimicrobiales bacterium]
MSVPTPVYGSEEDAGVEPDDEDVCATAVVGGDVVSGLVVGGDVALVVGVAESEVVVVLE